MTHADNMIVVELKRNTYPQLVDLLDIIDEALQFIVDNYWNGRIRFITVSFMRYACHMYITCLEGSLLPECDCRKMMDEFTHKIWDKSGLYIKVSYWYSEGEIGDMKSQRYEYTRKDYNRYKKEQLVNEKTE